jgi:hypothetical protein
MTELCGDVRCMIFCAGVSVAAGSFGSWQTNSVRGVENNVSLFFRFLRGAVARLHA